jgi:uncharacterized iron-regulated membrane protein
VFFPKRRTTKDVNDMKRFRTVLFWAHLITGATAAVVILLMSVTGVLLTYEKQTLAWADRRSVEVTPPSPAARPLGPEALLERVQSTEPGTPTALTWRAAADAPVQVAYGRERSVLVDPYTGAVLGSGATRTRAFFRAVTDWHRWLGARGESRDAARAVTGAANLGFLFLVISGFYLWWPATWTRKAFRNVAWFRRGLRPKARDFNWHNVIGFWSLVPLFVVVLSAVVISYPWASDLVYRLAGEEPPAGRGPGGGARPGSGPSGASDAKEQVPLDGIDPLWERARTKVPGWRILTLQIPTEADAPLAFTIDRGTGGQPQKRAQLAFDRATGEETRWEPFAAQTRGRKLRSILRFAHTGEVAGLPGQTIAGLVSAGAAVLVWTGLALAWRRFRAWTGRRRRTPEIPAREPREPRELAGAAD